MKIKFGDIFINVISTEKKFDCNKIPILFLHGFTGSIQDWFFFFNKIDDKFSPIAIDLIGHGETSSPDNLSHYSAQSIIAQIKFVLDYLKVEKVCLCGYSMGGRAAISFALEYPAYVHALILESSTAGIESEEERHFRITDDERWASIILDSGMENFVELWMKLPIFSTLKNLNKKTYKNLIANKTDNNPVGLYNSLKGFSTGKMPSYWNRLPDLSHKTLLITGELDEKYTMINKKMNNLLPNSSHTQVSNAGHNVHLEKPEDFIILLNTFSESL